VGTITLNLATLNTALVAGTDTATVTLSSAGAAIDNTFLGALTLSLATSGTTVNTGTSAYNGTGGYNELNNGAVTTNGTTTATLTAAAANFGTASGKIFLNVARASLASTDTGAKVYMDLTVSSAGVIQTYRQTLTLTIGAKAGTATITPSTGLQTVNLGGSATVTRVIPFTNAPANTSLTARTFTLADSGSGTAVSGGHATFSVAATATGGTVSCVRSSSTVITCTPLKNAVAGDMTVTYTTTVNAASTATAGNVISVDSFAITVQPYTPTYTYSTVSVSSGTNSYYVPASSGGDGIIWAPATAVAAAVVVFDVDQFDQNNSAISNAVYAKSVSATITGKGSFTEVTNASGSASVKTRSETATNGLLSGTSDLFEIWSDGTSGEGTVTISVNDVVQKTYTVRFYGDVATVSATALRPIGRTSGGLNGQTAGSAAVISAGSGVLNGLGQAANIKTVAVTDADAGTTANVTGIAVSVKDANGWVIPTSAPVVSSSNPTVVSAADRLFIDSGVSSLTAGKVSAGTFVQHFSYTTVAGSTSGATSALTFSVVNTAGTAIASTPITITVGGALASGKLAFDKATYNPGEVATITATGLDAAGNKAADGQNLMASDFESTLNFTAPASFSLVNGTRVRTVFAPLASGTWTIVATDAAGKTYEATATVRSPGDDAKKAADAATEAANLAADAAAEAIDAANAATDAANLAAEAADAATVAAEEARDAADAATAAVEELATQVATLMAALKAQITTLANTVAKIAKKVKA
jgi:hypothetical protein